LAYIKRLFASLGHGLLWLAVTYVIWGLVVRHRYIDAWNATAVGDTVPIVINRFGSPDYVESPLRFSQPEFCARPQEKCRDDYAIRLWYQLPFTFVVGGHVLVMDFDDRQHVINKFEMRSP
jgi:hypothetical protein